MDSDTESAGFEYLIQVFVTFVPAPQFQPLLLRVPELATVGDAIGRVLDRLLDADTGVPAKVPSAVKTHYALCTALGDGSVDPDSHTALDFDCVIRDARLQFPYMVALLHLAPAGSEAAGSPRMSRSHEARQASRAQLAAELSAEEREAAERRRAEVEAKRIENVRKIEARRAASDMSHFHEAESYELRRREDAAVLREEQRRKELARVAQEVEQQQRAAEAAKRAEAAQREELARHHQRMLELKQAEEARLAQARVAQAAHEAVLVEARRRANEERRQHLEATKHARMTGALDSIISSLDQTVVRGREQEESLAQSQFEARAAAARRAQQLREVQALEARRAEERAAERDTRVIQAQLAVEAEKLRALTIAEEEERKREAEEERFRQWRAQRAAEQSAVEGELELTYRVRKGGSVVR